MGSILSAISITLGEMARLGLLALVVFSAFIANSFGSSLRLQRDACGQTRQEYETCRLNAYAVYQSAMIAKPDDRPDWRARKTCTYMTTAIEDCANQQIGECFTEEEVAILIDREIPKIMAQLSTTVKEWNSELCPVVEDYLNRINSMPNIPNAENAGAENPGNKGESEGEKEGEGETEGEKETGSEGETEGEGETGEDSSKSSNRKTKSGSEAPVASLSLMIVLYTIFS